ncbi:response regulator [Catenovulum sp. SM1970]|uniref:hybrid sensor histidine kinase/response regulator transcription factor n=1 Tax=Marinifaba aquimaris TaxID=2741323 RepID=UPI001573F5BA|nr:hybrid sensor histidine kinase/response regulator transcription factor [Marinifaba aquimaris]NTS77609.1 response regulator [Marinifaba aquimaris]
MRCSLLLLISLFFFSQQVSAQIQHYFESYSIEQGLSQTSATCFVEDNQGFLWIGTQGGLNRFDGYEITVFKNNSSEHAISGNWITSCIKDNLGRLFFSTANNGISLYLPESQSFSHFLTAELLGDEDASQSAIWALNFVNERLIAASASGALFVFNYQTEQFEKLKITTGHKVNRIILANANQVLLATDKGLYQVSEDLQSIQFVDETEGLSISDVGIDKYSDNLLLATRKGLYTLSDHTLDRFELLKDESTTWFTQIFTDDQENRFFSTYGKGYYKLDTEGKLVLIQSDNTAVNSLSNNYLFGIYQDSQRNLWVGTDGGGVNLLKAKRSLLPHYKQRTKSEATLSHNFIRTLKFDVDGGLWLGTRKGLNYTRDNLVFEQFLADGQPGSLLNDHIFSLLQASDKKIWVGTYGEGLALFNPDTRHFQHFSNREGNVNFSADRIYAIAEAKDNTLWLGTNKGLTRFNPKTMKTSIFQANSSEASLSQNTVFSLLVDDENLWVGTRGGLNFFNQQTGQFTVINNRTDPQITDNMVISLLKENNETLWIGTMQGLNRLDLTTNQIIQFTEQDGLPNDNIFALEVDQQGYIWASTNKGLVKIDPESFSMQGFGLSDGIQANQFLLGASSKNRQGRITFAGVNGYNIFEPEILINSGFEQLEQSHPVITDFSVFNKSQINLTSNTYFDGAIDKANLLKLGYKDRLFSLKFSFLNFSDSEKITYLYRLKGFDDQWLSADSSRYATFSNIPAGQYQFEVKALLNGLVSETKVLAVTIDSAPWATPWAYLLYFGFTASLFIFILRLYLKKKNAEKASEIANEMVLAKQTLLDNVSHEFKTPLTLILSPLQLVKKQLQSAEQLKTLHTIERNAVRLLNMVEQMLELAKYQQQLPTEKVYQAGSPILKFIAQSFEPLARQKNIEFSFENSKDIAVLLPKDSLETILVNLLSNAFKYTESGGKVTLSTFVKLVPNSEHNQLELVVQDNGEGISKEAQATIFERFSRDSRLNYKVSGTGLGLNLVKEIVENHQGVIELESEHGQGTRVVVSLPCYELDKVESELTGYEISKPDWGQKAGFDLPEPVTDEKTQKLLPSDKKHLLIIDDNPDIRNHLSDLLNTQYHINLACDGEEGVELALTTSPDCIICDVMMPKLDGYQLVSQLRADILTSHIPILMLSAKSDLDSQLKGLTLLADDYLTKPFQPQELSLRLERLLSIRSLIAKQIQQQMIGFRNNTTRKLEVTGGHNDVLNIKDQQFIEHLNRLIEQHHGNAVYNIEQLANDMCLSVRALQLKTKALLAVTPNEYLRQYRLEQAKYLITHSKLNIGEIADRTGFSSANYFARCFRAMNNCTAAQYREQYSE